MERDGQLEAGVRAVLASLPGRVAVAARHLRTGRYIAIDEEQRFPAASVIKIPVLIALTQAAALGRLSLDTMIELDAAAPAIRDSEDGSGLLRQLLPRHRWSLGELALLMQMVSDNVATNALIDVLGGFTPVNAMMRGLGLADSVLDARIQDFDLLQRSNLVTARDMLVLLEALHHERVDGAGEALRIMRHQVYNGTLPLHLPADADVRHKTGGLGGVTNDAGLVYPHGEREHGYAIVLLSSGQAADATAQLALAQVSRLVYDGFGAL